MSLLPGLQSLERVLKAVDVPRARRGWGREPVGSTDSEPRQLQDPAGGAASEQP